MSQHPSLRIDAVRTKHRNVLKRHERIRRLLELGKWNDRESVLGLPKVKSLKIKVKKAKAEKPEAGKPEAAPGASPPASAAPAAPEKKKPSKTESK